MTKRLAFAGLLMAMTLLGPAAAAADTLTFNGLGKGLGLNVTFGSTSENVWVGEIKWTESSFGAIVTYCVDLFDPALWTETVTVRTTTALNSTNSAGVQDGAGGQAAWLFNNFRGEASADNTKAAALQLAIWQALYGQSFVSVNDSTVMNLAASYLNQMGGQTSMATYLDVDNISSTGHGQDQITTPEPATVLLLTMAMGATLGYRRRVNRRRTEA